MNNQVFLKRVVLNNYKSIKECSVPLGPLTFLVGQNGAGKSNFLDALRLVTESLNTSLEHALRERGGINEVRRRSSGHPTHFGIRLDWRFPNGTEGWYAFRVGSQKKGGFEVQQEECKILSDRLKLGEGRFDSFYKVENGELKDKSFKIGPPALRDRLYIVAASGLAEFRPLYDALSHMGFYNLNPDEIRELQPSDTGEVLKRDGSNLSSVLSVMAKENKEAKDQVAEFLSKVVPGIQGIDVKHVGKKETLEFRQSVGKNQDPWRFMAENMSDGTLRALGVLVALFQTKQVPFVGIEEPEVAVHPGAAGVIRDGLLSASKRTQIAVTSHSPDLLDEKSIKDDSILAVVNRNGETTLGPLDQAGRETIKERLYTAGELLRLGQIEPDTDSAKKTVPEQFELFGDIQR
jgi:predicted ATPase